MSSERRNRRVTFVGSSECGKSYAMERLFTRLEPRVLTVDPNAEKLEDCPGAIRTFGWRQLEDALNEVAELPRWRIAACLSPEYFPRLARMLVPEITSLESSSYAADVGGMVLECGEAHIFAPGGGRIADEVARIFTAGRHFRLSPFMATQSPAACDTRVLDNAQYIGVFQTVGAAQLERLKAMTSRAIAERVKRLAAYHFLLVDRPRACITHATIDHRTERPRVLEVLDFDGERLPRAA